MSNEEDRRKRINKHLEEVVVLITMTAALAVMLLGDRING